MTRSVRRPLRLAFGAGTAALLTAGGAATAAPVDSDDIAAVQQQIAAERTSLEQQQATLDAQRARLRALEDNLLGLMRGRGMSAAEAALADASSQPGSVPLPPSPPPAAGGTTSSANSVTPVGEKPTEQREVQVAVLAEQGGIITKAGRLTIEPVLEYAHADRNRVIFRGIEIPQSVLIGVFDINESRQDVLTAGAVARLGLTNRLEVNARVPYVRRSDKSVLAPVSDPTNPNAGQINRPAHGSGLGDIDFGVRYQLSDGSAGFPYLIAGVQAVAPTGTNPFKVPRDNLGNALKASTGAGFWGVTPTLTAILPTDPAVLFATVGYTRNFGRDINRTIGPAFIEYVRPGDEPSATAGIALSLNPRTSFSLGYAHTWSLGTKTRVRTADSMGVLGPVMKVETRDLQIGRLMFGVSYRTSPSTTINWNVELGATDDATDIRTTLRIPFSFSLF